MGPDHVSLIIQQAILRSNDKGPKNSKKEGTQNTQIVFKYLLFSYLLFHWTQCYGLIIYVPPPNSCVKVLTLNVVVFGDWAFER